MACLLVLVLLSRTREIDYLDSPPNVLVNSRHTRDCSFRNFSVCVCVCWRWKENVKNRHKQIDGWMDKSLSGCVSVHLYLVIVDLLDL